jgi:inorganic pyrophosphatase
MPIDALKPGTKPPDEINVVVEIPKRSKNHLNRHRTLPIYESL